MRAMLTKPTQTDFTKYDAGTLLQAAISPSTTPPDRIATAWEYAARAAVDKSLVSATIDGNSYNAPEKFLEAAKNETGEVKTALYATALVIAKDTGFKESTKKALTDAGMLETAEAYIAENPLRTYVRPTKTETKSEKKEKEEAQSGGPIPLKEAGGKTGGLYNMGTGDTRLVGNGPWVPIQRALDTSFDEPNFRFSSFMQNYLNGDLNDANSAVKKALAQAYWEYYQKQSGQGGNTALDKELGDILRRLFKDDYFKIYFGGQGDKARQLLTDGKLGEFFSMVANDLGNPFASDLLNKDAQASVETSRAYLMGVVDAYWEAGELLAKIRDGQSFLFPWLFFSNAAARIETYGKDITHTQYGLTSDLEHPVQETGRINIRGLKYARESMAASFAIDFPDFLSFFVEPRFYHSKVPEGLKNVDTDTNSYDLQYGQYGGVSIRISKTNPLTGVNRHSDVFFGADLSKSPILPDWDIAFFKQANEPLLAYTNLNLNSTIPLGSYFAVYLQEGTEMQYDAKQIASNKIFFIPRFQINFDEGGKSRLILGGRTAYDLGVKAPQYSAEANLFVAKPISFVELLTIGGQLEYIQQNWPNQVTGQVKLGITFK